MKLFVVESPSKTKIIQKYLGNDYLCIATCGHFMDIPHSLDWLDSVSWTNIPYVIQGQSAKYAQALKKAAKQASSVIVATDPDREGEAIAFSVMKLLNLDTKKTLRLRFDKITKQSIVDALDNPGVLDVNLVNAQITRRIIDLIYGFRISPIVSKAFCGKFSAGRCQSPSLGLIIERNKAVQNSEENMASKRKVDIDIDKNIKISRLEPLSESLDVSKWLTTIKEEQILFIKTEIKNEKERAPAPFVTSSLQIHCNRSFGLSPKQTMSIAQHLYENGWITYPRSDSPNLSNDFVAKVKEWIVDQFSEKYFKPNRYIAKVLSQEAHEAIRPVNILNETTKTNISEIADKVYHAIRKRAIASQMADCEYQKRTSVFEIKCDNKYQYVQRDIVFQGWKIIYGTERNGANDVDFKKVYDSLAIQVSDVFDTLKHPWTQADFIKALESSGIGRPSTYSNILSTLIDRQYIICESWPSNEIEFNEWTWAQHGNINHQKKKKIIGGYKKILMATPIGTQVYSFLSNNFKEQLALDFTKNLELQLDGIAEGNKSLYPLTITQFNDTILKQIGQMGPIATPKKESPVKQILHETPNYIYALITTRQGKKCIAQINKADENDKWTFKPYDESSARDCHAIESLFKNDIIGNSDEGQPILFKHGPFGLYITCDGTSRSCKERPTLEQAKIMLKDAPHVIANIGTRYKIIKGTKGIALSLGNKFANIPADVDYSKWKPKDCEIYMKANMSNGRKQRYEKKTSK